MKSIEKSIEFDCPKCGGHLAMDSSESGLAVPCPMCCAKIKIPRGESSADSSSSAVKIHFQCPKCNGRLACEPERATEKVNCLHCKKTITIPEAAKVYQVFVNDAGLETTLRSVGEISLVLCVLAAGLAVFAGISENTLAGMIPLAVTALLTGLILFYFFRWAGELLSAVKKIADLRYEPRFQTYRHEAVFRCSACGKEMASEENNCPGCKRALLWPDRPDEKP